VNLGFDMTINALTGCICELSILVAFCTTQIAMLPNQGKIRLSVVKCSHAILSIVAIQASAAKKLLVHYHELGIVMAMTVYTVFNWRANPIFEGVAMLTLDWFSSIIDLVPSQVKLCQIMIEMLQGRYDKVKVTTLMIRMTGKALHYFLKKAMGTSLFIYLSCNGSMAFQT
jgi:hypothetical protein